MPGDAETLLPADRPAGDLGRCEIDLVTGSIALSAPLRELLGCAGSGRPSLEDWRAAIHPADRQRIAEETAAAHDDPSTSVLRTRFRILRPDGSADWLEARDRIERDGAGRAVRTLGAVRAAAGRKRCEEPPDESRSRFAAALAHTSVVVFQQDLGLRYTWIHDAMLGPEAQRALGKTDLDLIGPELARPIEAIKRQVIETGQSAREEVTMPGRGTRCRYDLYVEPLRDNAGAIVGVTCAAIEIAPERAGAGGPPEPPRAISDRGPLLDRIALGANGRERSRPHAVVPCIEALRRKLGGYATLTREDDALLGLLEKRRRLVPARQIVKLAEGAANRSWLISAGWVYSYKALASGERQVVGFHLPGDLIGGKGCGEHGAGSSFATVTDCVLCEFDRGTVMKMRRSETMLPDALQWSDAREEAILQQHLISIGRRSAIARVAHLLLELGARLKLVGLADALGYKCPLSQELLGDALGLTKIHVNRMLRELRELGCLTFRNGHVCFGDMARLTELAEYDPAYLDLRSPAQDSPGGHRDPGLASLTS